MTLVRFTLLSEGSSDQALMPILTWTIQQHASVDISPQWADLRAPHPPRTLPEKIRTSLRLYPCDLLFVHRDADREGREERIREITNACAQLETPPRICVIPVRALEAWFLFDEPAIRRAAGNPNGKTPLDLPAPSRVEEIADPKKILEKLVRLASELEGRRRRRVEIKPAVHRIAELVGDFSPLRRLPAFGAFEEDLRCALQELLPT